MSRWSPFLLAVVLLAGCSNADEQLLTAVRDGALEEIETVLRDNPELARTLADEKYPALDIAIEQANVAVLERLLDESGIPSASRQREIATLVIALAPRDEVSAASLAGYLRDQDAQDSILEGAFSSNSADVLELFLEHYDVSSLDGGNLILRALDTGFYEAIPGLLSLPLPTSPERIEVLEETVWDHRSELDPQTSSAILAALEQGKNPQQDSAPGPFRFADQIGSTNYAVYGNRRGVFRLAVDGPDGAGLIPLISFDGNTVAGQRFDSLRNVLSAGSIVTLVATDRGDTRLLIADLASKKWDWGGSFSSSETHVVGYAYPKLVPAGADTLVALFSQRPAKGSGGMVLESTWRAFGFEAGDDSPDYWKHGSLEYSTSTYPGRLILVRFDDGLQTMLASTDRGTVVLVDADSILQNQEASFTYVHEGSGTLEYLWGWGYDASQPAIALIRLSETDFALYAIRDWRVDIPASLESEVLPEHRFALDAPLVTAHAAGTFVALVDENGALTVLDLDPTQIGAWAKDRVTRYNPAPVQEFATVDDVRVHRRGDAASVVILGSLQGDGQQLPEQPAFEVVRKGLGTWSDGIEGGGKL